MLARLAALTLVGLLGAGCGRSLEVAWPDSELARYAGPVARVDGELRARGQWRFWYANGVQQAEGDFRDAPLPGPDDLGPDSTRIPREGRARWWTFWDPEGRMLAEGQYRGGQRAQLWVCWYENGRQCCTGHFAADRPHGYHVTWYPDGTKRDERTYVDGVLDGPRTVRGETGAVVWTGEYRSGALVSSDPPGSPEPDVHDLAACAERAEHGLARSPHVALR